MRQDDVEARCLRASLLVAVVGSGQCSPDEADLAEAVGRELAQRGCILLCGGLGGVMEAACRGAQRGGGRTVGILPGDSPGHANPYVELPIATGLGEARNMVLVNSARAVIAVGGEFGTLSEIALALRRGIPVVGLGTWHLSKGGRPDTYIIQAQDPTDAVEKALGAIGGGGC